MEQVEDVNRHFANAYKSLAVDQGLSTEASLITSSVAQGIPAPILLVALTQLSVVDAKLLSEVKKTRKALSDIQLWCKDIKRRDHQGKLREILQKPFTGVFILKKKVSPGRFKLEFLGDKHTLYECFIPPVMLSMLPMPDLFNEGEIYIIANLACCVLKEPQPIIVLVFTPNTKFRSAYNPRLSVSKLRMDINQSMGSLKADLSGYNGGKELREIPCLSQQEVKHLQAQDVTLKGFVSEVTKMSSEGDREGQTNYLLKFFHHLTLIDEFKVYFKVFDSHTPGFEDIFTPGRLVEIPRTKRCYTADLNFSYRHAFYKNIDYLKGCDENPINPNATFKERLRMLKFKDPIPTTNLDTIGLSEMNRQILKIVVDLESIPMLELTLKCYSCRNRADYCGCDMPKYNLNTYAKLLVDQAGTPAYLIIQEYDVLAGFLDISPEESDFTKDYLGRHGEFSIFNERLAKDTKNYERKKVFSYFNKYVVKKAVYGHLTSKKDTSSNKENDGLISKEAMGYADNKPRSDYLYVNGSVKLSLDGQQHVLTPIITVKYTEKVPAIGAANQLYNQILALI